MLSIEDIQNTNRLWGVKLNSVKADNTNVLMFHERKDKFHKYKNADRWDLTVLNQDKFLGRILLGIDYHIQQGNNSPSHRSLMSLLGIKSLGYLREGLAVLEYLGAISIIKQPLIYPTAEGIKVNPLRFSHSYTINVDYRRI